MKKAFMLLTATAILIPTLALAQTNDPYGNGMNPRTQREDDRSQIRTDETQVNGDRSQIKTDEQIKQQDLSSGNTAGAYAEQRQIKQDRSQIHQNNRQIIRDDHQVHRDTGMMHGNNGRVHSRTTTSMHLHRPNYNR